MPNTGVSNISQNTNFVNEIWVVHHNIFIFCTMHKWTHKHSANWGASKSSCCLIRQFISHSLLKVHIPFFTAVNASSMSSSLAMNIVLDVSFALSSCAITWIFEVIVRFIMLKILIRTENLSRCTFYINTNVISHWTYIISVFLTSIVTTIRAL